LKVEIYLDEKPAFLKGIGSQNKSIYWF